MSAWTNRPMLRSAVTRGVVYGLLLGLIVYIQPAARCVLNPLHETNLLEPCLAAGDIVILPASSRAYTLTVAADLYKAAGQNDFAIVTSERAYSLDPTMEGGNYQVMDFLLGTAQASAARGDFPAAEVYFTRALSYDPTNIIALIKRDEVFQALTNQQASENDYAAALVSLDTLILQKSVNPAAFRYRGMIKARLGDTPGALIDLDEAIARGDRAARAEKRELSKPSAP